MRQYLVTCTHPTVHGPIVKSATIEASDAIAAFANATQAMGYPLGIDEWPQVTITRLA